MKHCVDSTLNPTFAIIFIYILKLLLYYHYYRPVFTKWKLKGDRTLLLTPLSLG